jgi:hypothetical protein
MSFAIGPVLKYVPRYRGLVGVLAYGNCVEPYVNRFGYAEAKVFERQGHRLCRRVGGSGFYLFCAEVEARVYLQLTFGDDLKFVSGSFWDDIGPLLHGASRNSESVGRCLKGLEVGQDVRFEHGENV